MYMPIRNRNFPLGELSLSVKSLLGLALTLFTMTSLEENLVEAESRRKFNLACVTYEI